METTPAEPSGGAVQGYARADVERYLAAAMAERARLETAIADAEARRAKAEAAAVGQVDLTARVRTALGTVQQELAARRSEVEREADAIVARAREEAATILRDARRTAHTMLDPAPETSAEAQIAPEVAPEVAVDAPADEGFDEGPDIDLTGDDDSFWQAPPPGYAPAPERNGMSNRAANGPAPSAVTTNTNANGNGNGNGDGLDADARAANGLVALLRRSRATRPVEAGTTEEDDAFFDFLRGALDDSQPLGPRLDDDTEAR